MSNIDWSAIADPMDAATPLFNTRQTGNVPTRKFYGGMDADELHRKQIIEDFFDAEGVYARPEPAVLPLWKRVYLNTRTYAAGALAVEAVHILRSLI